MPNSPPLLLRLEHPITINGTWRKRVQAFRASGVFDSSLKIILAAGCWTLQRHDGCVDLIVNVRAPSCPPVVVVVSSQLSNWLIWGLVVSNDHHEARKIDPLDLLYVCGCATNGTPLSAVGNGQICIQLPFWRLLCRKIFYVWRWKVAIFSWLAILCQEE